MTKPIISTSENETHHYASQVAASLKPGSVLALYGDLGSGKTTFTQGLAKALHIDQFITSPTFQIMREYRLPDSDNYFFHLDLYRLHSPSDLDTLPLTDIFHPHKNFSVIEWPELAKPHFHSLTQELFLKYIDPKTRSISRQSS